MDGGERISQRSDEWHTRGVGIAIDWHDVCIRTNWLGQDNDIISCVNLSKPLQSRPSPLVVKTTGISTSSNPRGPHRAKNGYVCFRVYFP